MSNATNITNNPTDACPKDLQYGIPDAWRDSTSSNFSQAACAAPACDNFPSTLAQCCGRAESDLYYFNSSIGPFASCAIANSNDTEAYQALQRCLADKEVRNFKCNDPEVVVAPNCGIKCTDPKVILSPSCGFGTQPPENKTIDWPIQQRCSLPMSVNATRAMKKCCSNYDSGDGLLVYSEGCYISCISDSTNGTFSSCLGRNYDTRTQAFVCTANDGRENPDLSRENPDLSVGAQTSPSLAAIFTILLLGSSMLML
ncbi:hypothetical protein KCU95_g7874, partial [Aureobasidium melanogenum]